MSRYIAQGKKAVDAFMNNREARETLRQMGREMPEDSPALQPLRTALLAFSGRINALSGMPERPYEVVEQEAVEAAQQLQNALNDLSAQNPELYQQQAEAFERAWQGLGLEIEGAAPKSEEAEKVDFFSIKSGAFMRRLTRAAKNNGPELAVLDELAARMEKSPEKDKLKASIFRLNRIRETCKERTDTIDTPQEDSGDYFVSGTNVSGLRAQMAKLQKSDPKLYEQVFGPFLQAMGKLDFSKDQAEFTRLENIQKEAQAKEEAFLKQVKEEAMSHKVTLYGNVEITEFSGMHFTDSIRSDIVNSPGYQEAPPSIDPKLLAKLIWVTANTTDYGAEKPVGAAYAGLIETESAHLWKRYPEYLERLGKEPEVARLLSQREEGKTWTESSAEKLTRYMGEVFDIRYEPNRASAETSKETAAVLTEAYDTFLEYGVPLQNGGNKEIGFFCKSLRDARDKDGASTAALNIRVMVKGRAFLNSITEPGMEQTEETRKCLQAALKAMHALTPADEFDQICRDMNQRLGVENDPTHKDYVTPKMFDPKDLKSGLKLIDDLKKGLKTDESARDAAAKIMAARILTNTKGGKASYLDIPISRTRVDQVAEALKGSDSFRKWLGGMDKDKAAKLLSGHGGDLEKSFKDHLKKLPAGELRNDPALQRYMPTAKERIEELQKQAVRLVKERDVLREQYNDLVDVYREREKEEIERLAKKGKAKGDVDIRGILEDELTDAKAAKIPLDQANLKCAAAAAEIIAIRNACKVEKGGAGLGRQIPPARGASNIADTVSLLANDDDMQDLLIKKAVQSALQKGHGGQMMVDVRKLAKNSRIPFECMSVLKENTVEYRKDVLREEADRLYTKLDQLDAEPSEALMKQTRRVLGEYAALVVPPTSSSNPEQDMKWQAMDKMVTSAETDPLFVAMTANADIAQAMMDAIGSLEEGEFRQKFTELTNTIQGKQTEKAGEPEAPEKEAEAEKDNRTRNKYTFEHKELDPDLELC